MTLVIPSYYTEHNRKSCTSSTAYPSLVTSRNVATMPCGFDGEPMDFETVSASFDPGCCWPTLDDLTEYRSFSGSGQVGVASSSAGSKRKDDDEDGVCNADESDAKKFRIEVAADESGDNASDCDDSTSSSSSSDSSPDGTDDLFCPPRRRGPLLWSPKLRWKDERRKVLKISLAKIRIIEDPEVFLRRSVLINNTLKRLQQEITEEKSSRYRDPYLSYPFSSGGDESQDGVARCWGFECQPEDPFPGKVPRHIDSTSSISSSSPSSSSSSSASLPSPQSLSEVPPPPPTCDEIFGVNEDMLRINMPPQKERNGQMGPTTNGPASSPPQQRGGHSPSSSSSSSSSPHPQPSSFVGESTCTCRTMNSSRNSCASKRPNSDSLSRHFDLNAMGHCATQYRTVQEHGEGLQGGSILDSVVYHSLLASLES